MEGPHAVTIGCRAAGSAPTVAIVEMTRRRLRRDSGCIVRSSVCFQMMPASSSCRQTAFLISNGSPAQPVRLIKTGTIAAKLAGACPDV